MTTRFDKDQEKPNVTVGGYEGENKAEDFVIPSCGIEDLDYAIFNLFNSQIPLFHELKGEQKRIPVIFATGERFALLRRKKPITDKSGALILPLISVTRSNIDNNPSKGMSNNQMFPEVIMRRISKKNTEWRQLNNFEGFNSIKHSSVERETKYSLSHQVNNNIYQTIEVPPVKYFGATYEVSIWCSFTQQMNEIVTTIMSSYTQNPGQQFKVESKSGYWFPAFVENSFSQDSTYADYTDQERFIKYNMTLSATGFILAPNLHNGKVALKSILSSPTISFETMLGDNRLSPINKGITTNDPDAHLLNHIKNEEDKDISQHVGIDAIDSLRSLQQYDKSSAYVVGDSDLKKYDFVGERSSRSSSLRKILIEDDSGEPIEVQAHVGSNGETLYDQKYIELIFNISNSNK